MIGIMVLLLVLVLSGAIAYAITVYILCKSNDIGNEVAAITQYTGYSAPNISCQGEANIGGGTTFNWKI